MANRRAELGAPLHVVIVALAFVSLSCSAGGAGSPDRRDAIPTTTGVPVKVTVAGDSISIGLGASLRSTLGPSVTVKVIGEEGTGLARPDRFDWPKRLSELARDFPPNVLVLSLSSNDAQDLRDAAGNITVTYTATAAWDAEYAKRLAASFDAFAPTTGATVSATQPTPATRVVWVSHVRTAEDRVGLHNRRVHQLAGTVAATRPWVQVEDLASLLGTADTPAGRCLMADGLHLTSACLDEAAAKLAPRLRSAT